MSSIETSLYMFSTLERFQHWPLDTEQQELRLVTVHPRRPGELLNCSIEHISLAKRPETEYAALSYCWGTPETAHWIILNGNWIAVRSNLFDFLDGVASLPEVKSFCFWIDQLSIDQENNQEKNHQVWQMTQIFSRAREVIVWLGKTQDDSERAMQTLNRWRSTSRTLALSDAQSLTALFCRPFWTRLWVIQEVVLAKRVFVLCGDSFVDWVAVQDFFDPRPLLEIKRSPQLFAFPNEVESLFRCQRGLIQGKPSLSMLRALHTFRDHKCEDIHDKIYGLLGIVLPEELEGLPVDYSQDVRTTFIDVAEHLAVLNLPRNNSLLGHSVTQQVAELGRSMGVIYSDDHETVFRLKPRSLLSEAPSAARAAAEARREDKHRQTSSSTSTLRTGTTTICCTRTLPRSSPKGSLFRSTIIHALDANGHSNAA